jgi:Transcriptional Coactivator p15 (PC4)
VAGNGISLPCVIAEWPKNARETIRISLSEYWGHAIVDCRQWYLGGDGELKPSPKGLTLALAHLPALAKGLADALKLACNAGLVEGGEQ